MSHSRHRPPKVRVIVLAAVCCVALFALSAPTFAMPIRGPINAPTLDQVPASPVVQPSDIPPGSAATTDAPSYRSGDTPATRVADATTPKVTTPSVTHTVAQDTSDQTLAIVLAGSALAIALAGSGFALLRSRMPKAAGLH